MIHKRFNPVNSMHKYFLPSIILLGLILALPMTASAVWNGVQFTAATNVYIPELGVTLVASTDSKVASLVVSGSNVVISGAYVSDTEKSSITLTSAQKQMFSNDWGLTTTCGTSSSTLTVTWSAATSGTSITITPTGSCPVEGGGGGGGGAVQVVTPTPTAPTTTTGTVTATASAGGKTTVTTTEGTKATVELPAAAVTADTTVTVASVSVATVTTATAAAPAGKTIASAFQLSATTSAGAAVTSFAKIVTVTVTYTDAQITGLDEASLKVYRWDGTQWVVLSTTVNATTNTLTATTTAFSYFAIMGEPPAAVPEVPVVTPPVKPISEMTIEELKAEITRIATLIAQLQVELAKLIGAPQAFVADLSYGMKANSEVKLLQEFLISKGYLASGFNTGNYLSLTVEAVKAYQTAKGITPVAGYFGPKTRAAVNTDLGVSQ